MFFKPIHISVNISLAETRPGATTQEISELNEAEQTLQQVRRLLGVPDTVPDVEVPRWVHRRLEERQVELNQLHVIKRLAAQIVERPLAEGEELVQHLRDHLDKNPTVIGEEGRRLP